MFRVSSKRVILIGAVLAAVCNSLAVAPRGAAAQAASNPYPVGQSTYWAWQNRPDLPASLGQPKDWAKNASLLGWPVTAYPRPYSIAVFAPGVLGADPMLGHVAVVKQVFADGSYSTTQMDEADCAGSASNCGKINSRVVAAGSGAMFIQYKHDTRTTWGFAGGASGWTPVNMGQGSAQGAGWSYLLKGSDSRLDSPELEIPLDSYNAVDIDMALDPLLADATVEIDFATTAQAQGQLLKGGTAAAIADGATHTVHISLAGNPSWTGILTALSLRPAWPDSVGSVTIERIHLVHDENPDQAPYTQLTERVSNASGVVYRTYGLRGEKLY